MNKFLRRTGFFLCLLALAASSLSILLPSVVHAKGEQGTWVDENTIQLSGGRVQGTVTFSTTEAPTTTSPRTFTTSTGITDAQTGCKVFPTLSTPTPTSPSGTLYFGGNDSRNSCTQSVISDYDTSIAVAPSSGQFEGTSATGTAATGSADESQIQDCSVGVLSWIICPLVTLMADVIDWVAGILNDYLQLNLLSFDADNPVYKAWSNVRNIANIAFVVVFIVVIYSQATSALLSSYGIQRIMPRLVVAAVFVNISYFLCAGMIDISNIVGNGITGVIQNVNNAVVDPQEDGGLALNIGQVVVGAGLLVIVWFFLLGPILFTIIATFFVIAFRSAIVILLTIISPLAFVAWILPNTEKYFEKWLQLFVGMLVMYPLVMAAYAASVVASNVVRAGDSSVGVAIISVIILTLPLFALPIIFKISGGILGRIDNLTRSSVQNLRNHDRVQETKKRAQGYIAMNTYDPTATGFKGKTKNAFARAATGNRGFVTRGARQRARFNTAAVGNQYYEDQIKLARNELDLRNITGDKDKLYVEAKKTRNTMFLRRAAMDQLGEIGAGDKMADLYWGEVDKATGNRKSHEVDLNTKRLAAKSINSKAGQLKNSSHPLFFDASTFEGYMRDNPADRTGGETLARKVREGKVVTNMGTDFLVNLRPEHIIEARKTIESIGDITVRNNASQSVAQAIDRISKDPRLLSQLDDEHIMEIGKMVGKLGISPATVDAKFKTRYNTAINTLKSQKLSGGGSFAAGEDPNPII